MAFSFINYDGPTLPEDPSVRKLIRRQAMKDVAVDRRIRGGYGQHNLRQYPVFLGGDTNDEDSSSPGESPPDDQRRCPSKKSGTLRHAPSRRRAYALPLSIPYPDIATVEKFALLLNLTPLTGLRLGIAKFSSLKSELVCSENTRSVSNLGSSKLAHFITSRYAEVPMLRYATDCVIAKLRKVLRSPGSPCLDGEDKILVHYTKALRALQAALDDEKQRMTAETLCAIELLGIFELLDENLQSHSWMHHAGGAAQLIQIRGAHRFNTQFEMTLFMAHLGPTVMDAFLGNKPCFLAEEGWKQILDSAISSDDSFVQQKDLALPLWSHLVTGPRKFKEVTDTIASPTPPPQGVIDAMIGRLLKDRESLLGWVEAAKEFPSLAGGEFEEDEYGIMFPRPTFGRTKSNPDHASQLALWGTYVMCRILKSRLLVAMAPLRFSSIEIECQRLASRIMSLGQDTTEKNGEGLLHTFFISQSTWIAKGVLDTKDIWSEGQETNGEGMIESWKFEAWCTAIGRKFPSNE